MSIKSFKSFFGLSDDTNKAKRTDREEGAVSELSPELSLEMDDSELIKLSKQWKNAFEEGSKEWSEAIKKNEEYWIGKQFGAKDGPVDNLIFESLETFLPIATRPKAEPVIEAPVFKDDPMLTGQGKQLADKVRQMVIKKADDLAYNMKLKQVARYWALNFVGVLKMGWSMEENDLTCYPVRAQKLILDPDAEIREGEYTGYYIGEYRSDVASDLIERFPEKADYISNQVKGKLGTKLQYIEWWTNKYVFWTLDKQVLGKAQNPHWNYDEEVPAPVDEFGMPQMDPMTGMPATITTPGNNHFKSPKMPYIFLSVFNLGKHPWDDTNLIAQNLGLQDLINKRIKQIDRNADNTNGGLTVSGDFFTREQAAEAEQAYRKGGTIWQPHGDVNAGVKRETGPALPAFVYESLIDYRNELRNIFGTRGSTPEGTQGEKTVRGKIITKGQDADRIGGGISTYFEQFSDIFFNWCVQLMVVYYDEPHNTTVTGDNREPMDIQISSQDFIVPLTVGVKEGSMIPKDPMTKRNEAVDLYSMSALDPITLFEQLEFPDPRESAKQLYLWQAAPHLLFPDEPGLQPQMVDPMTGQPVEEQLEAPVEGDPLLAEVPIE